MRLLVTGGAGFIGSNYIHHVLHTFAGVKADCCPDQTRYPVEPVPQEVQIFNVDALTYAADVAHLQGVADPGRYQFHHGDICDTPDMERVVRGFEPDAIVHFAAESHVDRSVDAGDVFVRTNVLGTQSLLDVARRCDVPAFHHVSTDEVYGSTVDGSFVEGDPYHPGNPYAASKAGSDMLVLAHYNTYGTPATITRCTNNYGPRQHPEKLLPKMVLRARRGLRLPVYGTGQNVRDWLYVKDHCAAIHHVLGLSAWGQVYNVAGRNELANLDVVHMVLDQLGKPRDLVELVADRPGHDWRYSLDDSKLRASGWAPRTTFREGLADTFRWLENVELDNV